MLRKLIDWLFFGKLDAEREVGTRRVLSRYSRGNVAVQDGRYMSKRALRSLRAQGDRAFARLAALRARAK